MILFKNWKIEHIDGIFARQYDNLSRVLLVKDVPDGYDWAMLVKAGGNFDKLFLSPMEGGVGVVLTRDMLALDGFYSLQLVGTLQADGVTVRHTNVIQVYVSASLSGDAHWPAVPSEFSQVEANILELNAHPPVPGDNGCWMVWDLDKHAYAESEFPLPDMPVGPSGADGRDGTTFTPSVSDGILSWTNDGGLENPEPADIRGPSDSTIVFANAVDKPDGTPGLDMTFEEIVEATKKGKIVFFRDAYPEEGFSGYMLPSVVSQDGGEIVWHDVCMSGSPTVAILTFITLHKDNSVDIQQKTFTVQDFH